MARRANDSAAVPEFLRLAALSAVLVAVGALAIAGADDLEINASLPAPVGFVVVLGLFITAELVKFHVEVYRQALSVSLSDLPLVMGLFLIDPLWLVLARLLAGALVFLVRRPSPPKALFNFSLFVAEIGVAAYLLGLLREPGASNLADWLSAFAVILAVDVLDSLAVITAIGLIQGRLQVAEASRMIAAVIISGALSTTLALMALESLRESPAGLLLLAIFGACLTLGYRAYAQLLARHDDLGQLFDASRQMGAASTADQLEDELVVLARLVARADHATLVPFAQVDGDPVLGTATARALTRASRDPAERVWLDKNGHDDALLIPIRSDGNSIATLVVTDRQGSSSSFTADDLRRVQMLTGHAEVLWANGKLVEQLRYDAYHDDLTGLSNRSGFMQTLAARLEEAAATHAPEAGGTLPDQALTPMTPTDPDDPDTPCEAALLLFDLDRFKEVNDTLGHHVGDTLLVMVADRFQSLAPPGSSVARLGGDEFAILLPEAITRETVRRIAEHVRSGVGAALDLSGTILEVGASVGMAAVPADGREPATLLRRADVAMYAAKRSGGVAWYSEADDDNSIDRLKMLSELRKAIEDGDLKVAFQPQFSLATSEVVGFEALARWSHPSRGPVPPEEFVAMAEQGGLASMLTTSVLRQSLQQCREWLPLLPDTRVAVNLSPRLMSDPDLPALVAEMLQDAGVPPHLLMLELTEHSLMGGSDTSLKGLHEMRSQGMHVSVDDFGTGYSSLAYLRNLPVDEVKIDKMFVIPMVADPGSEAIVRSVVALSHKLGLTVVAEGIEDEETRALVAGTGCDLAQGFGLSRPISALDLPAWIRAHVAGLAEADCPVSVPSTPGRLSATSQVAVPDLPGDPSQHDHP